MKKVILGIGVPGSGKTTILKAFADRYGCAYISPDDIRQELSGSTTDQSRNKEVWDEAYRRLKAELESDTSVVFDATFTHGNGRKDFIGMARQWL